MHRINTSQRWPLKIWASLLEPQAEEQALNLAKLPFIHKHVALMPDAHAGKGSTIGSVIATKGAIIPSAVGVDIGCFTADTKVPLLDGTMHSLGELAKRKTPFYVYSVRKTDKAIVPGLATCLKTRSRAALCEVRISGGEVITCTPDHEFMLRDGSFCQAQFLESNVSLMPLYRRYQTRDGYESVYNPGVKSFRLTHRQIFESAHGRVEDGHVVHHINHDLNDNTPVNLESMTAGQHSAHHREHDCYFRDNGFQARKMKTIRSRGYFVDIQAMPLKRQVARENITAYMRDRPEHFKASVVENGVRGKVYLENYNTSAKGRAKSRELASKMHSCGICGESVKSYIGLHNHNRKHHNNHKVLSVTHIARRADVFCLQVEEHHNFALAAGIFVHNCGMSAVPLNRPLDAFGGSARLRDLRDEIEKRVPVGRAGHTQPTENGTYYAEQAPFRGIEERVQKRIAVQCGTLGGGNHFIELCGDENMQAWVVLHSGSRYLGNYIASKHIECAKGLMKDYFIDLPDPDLAYLAERTEEFRQYISDMYWAQEYAADNRRDMMIAVLGACARHLSLADIDALNPGELIDCHHNYTTQEQHFGANVWVTRKGAVCARKGVKGIIPGSMGAKSYIVEGLGNADSFDSCAHGAGRTMSRTQAKATFTLQDLIAQTAGVECSHRASVVDEIPAAYKPIDVVMRDQVDLVRPLHTLKQVLCVKG